MFTYRIHLTPDRVVSRIGRRSPAQLKQHKLARMLT